VVVLQTLNREFWLFPQSCCSRYYSSIADTYHMAINIM